MVISGYFVAKRPILFGRYTDKQIVFPCINVILLVQQLQKPVKADGNVEVWLMSLLKMAHASLHGVIRTAAMAISDSAFQLLEFLNMFPSQVR